jgi:hypothetical protein
MVANGDIHAESPNPRKKWMSPGDVMSEESESPQPEPITQKEV